MLNIRHQIDLQKFVLLSDGETVGDLSYRADGKVLEITYTRIEPEHRGKGYARRLVNAAVQEAEKHGLALAASCDYAEQILAREGRLAR